MHLFYSKDVNKDLFLLSPDESLHCVKVLRFRTTDKVLATNGNGLLVEAELLDENFKGVMLKTTKVVIDKSALDFKLHVALSPLKNPSRFEWFVEKAVEFGITEITPIISEKTEKKHLKIDRLQKIALEAMKQSLHCFLPQVNESVSFNEFVSANINKNKFIAWCGDADKQVLNSELLNSNDIVFLIGPEGDFTQKEFQFAKENNFSPISLGNYRLRSETAAVYVCSSMNFVKSNSKI